MFIDCLWVRLLINIRLLVVKFRGSQKFYADFQLHGVSVPKPSLFKGQLYICHLCFLIPDCLSLSPPEVWYLPLRSFSLFLFLAKSHCLFFPPHFHSWCLSYIWCFLMYLMCLLLKSSSPIPWCSYLFPPVFSFGNRVTIFPKVTPTLTLVTWGPDLCCSLLFSLWSLSLLSFVLHHQQVSPQFSPFFHLSDCDRTPVMYSPKLSWGKSPKD